MILITGASGFLGTEVLSQIPSTTLVTSIGRRNVNNTQQHIQCNLSKEIPAIKGQYDKVLHIAGKAHVVPKSDAAIEEFYETNLQGTIHLLKALDKLEQKPKQFIFISSVSVYGVEEGKAISENYATNPTTPYGKSKLEAEKEVVAWCERYDINYLILRLPLLVGANPPGNLGQIKRAIQKGRYPRILPNSAKKSMVLVKDVAKLLVSFDSGQGIYHLTDNYHPTFSEIERAIEYRVNRKIRISLPLSLLKKLAKLGDSFEYLFKKSLPISTVRLKKLTTTLTFDDTKAQRELQWQPQPVLPFIEKQL